MEKEEEESVIILDAQQRHDGKKHQKHNRSEEKLDVLLSSLDRVRKHEKDKDQMFLSKENAEAVIRKHLARQKSEEDIHKCAISPPPTPLPSPCEDDIAGEVIPARATNMRQLLVFTTVENLLMRGGNIIALKDSDTVEHALQIFREYEIQSAPVYSGEDFLGLVDTSDILSFFCSIERERPNIKHTFLKHTLQNLIEIARCTAIPVVPIGCPLSEVMKILATGNTHRVEIFDDQTHSLFNIVSQLSIIQFVGKNISLLLPEQRSKPVSEFMKWMNCIRTIPSDTSTYNTFGYLYNDGISAAAVVDSTSGKVIDTISTTDLIGLIDDGFEYLESSIVDFLCATRRTKALKPPITCQLSDTLEYVLIKLASTKVHRLWVTEAETNRYLGLVNLTNVLEALTLFVEEDE